MKYFIKNFKGKFSYLPPRTLFMFTTKKHLKKEIFHINYIIGIIINVYFHLIGGGEGGGN